MRYIIYGAGAVGGVIGARLFEHEREVVLIARGAHFDAIREKGLVFETASGSETLPIPVVRHPSELQFRADDVAIMTTKTQHSEGALDDLRAAAGADVPVVCAENGVENERMALRRFRNVYAMLVFLPATHLVPGVVHAHAMPVSGVLDAGRYPTGVDDVITTVTSDLDASGFSARPVSTPMRLKYAKLLSNLGNAIQATCDGDTRALHAQVRDEAIACYRAAGIDWASDEETAERRKSMSRPATVNGQMRGGGSSWQSLARRTGSVESDYLNGEIALLGRLHGVPTQANGALQLIAGRMAREGMAPGSMSVAEIEREIAAQSVEAPTQRQSL
ncbi:MAG: ketopantoate reductase family protein [Chloroflexota bacterium]|nr:ketopantoate reductase family protein [Chloroflexota bacterium]